ncbi:hypothetical protein ACFJI0_07465 [Hydrogenophaga sp. UC242_53]|uniref:hypothetical protein n=1 Tax=Hydrogenophaga sp. UC242_53 TaxID=3350170 RepID=UPI0036D2CB98
MRALASERGPEKASAETVGGGVGRRAGRRWCFVHKVAARDQVGRERGALALEQGEQLGIGFAAIGQQQQGALALRELALPGSQLGAALLGLVQHGISASFTEPALWTAHVTAR